ncbi:hypothetical protein [Flavicella sp.]|uniref:hypothetical protein n=1 Tax=Flavicella sp. TaxID=2957742 RepID=UPI00260FC2A2|nr:hypothetical protein [Flavicella sp.]MDG1805501.1 hypothetical protein [Flavicella sp.]MDG2280126.1 hypothetical protein [Flavicella sp.]
MKKYRILFVMLFSLILTSCAGDENISQNEEGIDKSQGPSEVEEEEGETGGESSDVEIKIVDGIKYGPNFLVFEPEITKSDLGEWKYRKKGDAEYFDNTTLAPINEDYLEFEGNSSGGGSPKSPIEIVFTCPKTAKYNLVGRLLQNFPVGESFHDDHSNDIWIQLKGDFTSATSFSTEQLKVPQKYFGRGVNGSLPRSLGVMTTLEIDHVKGLASYNLIKDEEYTLIISGRSKNACIDYLSFYDSSLGLQQLLGYKKDPAVELDEIYLPTIN